MNPDSDNIYSKRTNNLDFLFWGGEKVMRRDRHHVRPERHHVRPFLSYLVAKNVFFELKKSNLHRFFSLFHRRMAKMKRKKGILQLVC